MSGTGRSCLGPSYGDMSRAVLNSGASSLVTDANSALSGGRQLQRSASINTESYMRLPSSPKSFSSNNISGSSGMEGSSILQQSPEQGQKQGASTASSQSTVQEPGNSTNAQKKPRLEMRQEDLLQQQMIQQLLQRRDSVQMQGRQNLQIQGLQNPHIQGISNPQLQALQNPQLQAIFQQRRLAQHQQQQQQQQQQMLQSLPPMQRAQISQQQQQQLRHLQQHAVQPVTPAKRPFDCGICSRRLMQYLYHQRHRPADNSILYWRKVVAEYFAPRAKKRWCLSLYDNIGNHALGIFPQTAKEAWQCDICGSKAGKGFEATFEVLPRLCQIKFDRGVVDELLFLDLPHECRLSSGIMVLEYAKVVQESVYEHIRVVREGQLRVIFSPELKILSWEFCARRHEELIPRRLLAPQVNQLLQVAQKYQATITESGSTGVPHQDLEASCNMFLAASHQLARNMEMQSLNDLGFSKRYVRCLQVAEVVNSMKDLIDFSQEQKIGPIESLMNYAQQAAAKLQSRKLQDAEQLTIAPGLHAGQSTLNKIMGAHPGIISHMNNNLVSGRVLNNAPQGAVALNNYQNLLRNSLNPNQNVFQQETSSSLGKRKQEQLSQFQGSVVLTPTNTPSNGLSASQQQQPTVNGSLAQQGDLQPSQVNQHLQQQVIQQLLQEVINNNRGSPQQPLKVPNMTGNIAGGEVLGSSANGSGSLPVRMITGSGANGVVVGNVGTNMPNNSMTSKPGRSNSFKSGVNNPSVSGDSLNSRPELHQNMDMPELNHIAEFVDNGLFDGEPADMGYEWKV